MILGMSARVFTLLHVIVSLLAIASGVTVLAGLLTNRIYRRSNSIFLATVFLTCITGFAFPNTHITPGILVGILSLVTLLVAAISLHVRHLSGIFRGTYVVSTIVTLYFEMFVLVAQLFQHIPPLAAVDPSGQGPAFALAQLLVLTLFIWAGTVAFRRFTTASITTANTASKIPLAGE